MLFLLWCFLEVSSGLIDHGIPSQEIVSFSQPSPLWILHYVFGNINNLCKDTLKAWKCFVYGPFLQSFGFEIVPWCHGSLCSHVLKFCCFSAQSFQVWLIYSTKYGIWIMDMDRSNWCLVIASSYTQGSYRSWKSWKDLEFQKILVQVRRFLEFWCRSWKVLEIWT